ncbi:MAG: molybdopterin-dependent oxidoreductase [Thermodesulfobacteriota bacterium]
MGDIKRRDFLKFIGVGGVGAGAGFVLAKVSRPPGGSKLIPYLIPPEEIIPGVANYYATVCPACSAGCGAHVRVMDGRVKKLEGNPEHPVSRGTLCARGQASVQTLYNPDRIRKPLKRKGPRGSGEYTEISWEEALRTVTDNLAELKVNKNTAGLYLLTPPLKGHLSKLVGEFMAAYGSANHVEYELFQHRNLRYANKATLGVSSIPYYNIEKTKYLLSFGADFASTWLSPVNLSSGYGRMRQGPGARGKLVQVEPRLSLTGANADEWVPARPGTEALLALSIANAIVESGLYRGKDAGAWRSALKEFSPGAVARTTDVAAGRIEEIAREFASTRPSLAIAGENLSGYQNGVAGVVAVNVLNHLAGNIGVEGGVIPNPDDILTGPRRLDFKSRVSGLAADAAASRVKVLFIGDTNPVFTTPGGAKIEDALKKVPFIASFASFIDETSSLADIILPSHTPLEDWGDDFADPATGTMVASIAQPAVSPFYDTKSTGDIFLALAKGLGGPVGDKLKDASFAAYLKDSWRKIYSRNREMSAGTIDFGQFWNKALQRGGWWPKPSKPRAIRVSARQASKHISKETAKFSGSEGSFPFYLIPYAQAGHFDGRGANLPWLQELSDPMTSVVWGSWVEINPATARKLDIKEGDMVAIESPQGRIEAPAYLYPGIRPDTVAVPIGQGHRTYGRYAKKRGANPIEILPAAEDAGSGAYALNSTRVKLSRGLSRVKMVKMEGSTDELGRGIVQTVSHKEFRKMKKKEEVV